MDFTFEPPNRLAPRTLTEFAATLRKARYNPAKPKEYAAVEAIKYIADWAARGPFHFRNPGAPVWHKLKDGLHGKNGGHVGPDEWKDFTADFLGSELQIFVVEHDWAAAFDGATDFDAGSYRLPYDRCCFEFLLNGLRVCALLRQAEGEDATAICWASKNDSWIGVDPVRDVNLAAFGAAIDRNIRAVCIALDADVAYSETIRVPEKMNRSRLRTGKNALPDYHVIKLRQRPRAAPMDATETTGARKRLHFRRGHWRHFTEHKTWIKWTLVGDPDMAFVDKYYRA